MMPVKMKLNFGISSNFMAFCGLILLTLGISTNSFAVFSEGQSVSIPRTHGGRSIAKIISIKNGEAWVEWKENGETFNKPVALSKIISVRPSRAVSRNKMNLDLFKGSRFKAQSYRGNWYTGTFEKFTLDPNTGAHLLVYKNESGQTISLNSDRLRPEKLTFLGKPKKSNKTLQPVIQAQTRANKNEPRRSKSAAISWKELILLNKKTKSELGSAPLRSKDEISQKTYHELREAELLWATDGTISTTINQYLRKKKIASKFPNVEERKYWTAYYQGTADLLGALGLLNQINKKIPGKRNFSAVENSDLNPRIANQQFKKVKFNDEVEIREFNPSSAGAAR